MKNLNTYIYEKLKIVHKSSYSCTPQSKVELNEIIKHRLEKDSNANLNDINVSNIIDMSYLFSSLDPHNIDISDWDVSNVENMHSMFYDCRNFNSDLSNWDVSKVEDMGFMFKGCAKFNSDINDWDVSKVEDMGWMFERCDSMKELPEWAYMKLKFS